jgi:phage recombination protein Bet
MNKFTSEEVAMMREVGIIPQECDQTQADYFISFCESKNLNPLLKEVYLTSRWDKKKGTIYIPITGIDGYRIIASRTGDYAGSDDPTYNGSFSMAEVAKEHPDNPITSTVTVYKMVQGTRCPFSATARWEEYKPKEGQDFMWKKMAYLMLAKVAEALALRKAFPDALAGVYTEDEVYGTTYSVDYAKSQGVVTEPEKKETQKKEDLISPPPKEEQQDEPVKEPTYSKQEEDFEAGRKSTASEKTQTKKSTTKKPKSQKATKKPDENLLKKIEDCSTIPELVDIFNNNPEVQKDQNLMSALSNKKAELQKAKKGR